MITYHCYVTFDRVPDYLLLGWCPSPALVGMVHGQFAVLMTWLCQCRVVEPKHQVEASLSAGQ